MYTHPLIEKSWLPIKIKYSLKIIAVNKEKQNIFMQIKNIVFRIEKMKIKLVGELILIKDYE